ncbi:hypothetical protein ACLKA6_018736, partial [Drosophila palustris]
NSSPVMEPIREHNFGLKHFLSADPTPGGRVWSTLGTHGMRFRSDPFLILGCIT